MNSAWQRAGRVSRRGVLRAGALVSAGGALLAACGGSGGSGGTASKSGPEVGVINTSATQAAAAANKPTPKRGGKFGSWSSTSANFNIIANYYEGYFLSGAHVYDKLLTSRPDERRYVLEAAASVEQTDPLTVIFKLKPGMKYQDIAPVSGRAVKADDIVATQNYVRQATNAENAAFVRNFVDKVEASDDTTVTYRLKQPSAYLFTSTFLGNSTSQPIVPKELHDNLDTNRPVGSGPYFLAEWQMNTRYLYKRFDGYRDAAKGLPYIDEREMVVITDAVAQEAAFRSEQIHWWWNTPVSVVDRVANEMGAKAVRDKWVGFQIFAWDLNGKADTWKDIRVREALYRLTNRQQVAQLAFTGKAVVPAGPIPAGLQQWQLDPKETEAFFKTDVQAAKQLLQAAGWDSNKEYEIICSASSPTNQQSAEVWQQQLAQGGVKMRVQSLPFAEWLPNRIAPGKFDIILGGQPAVDTPARAMRLSHSDQRDQFQNMGLFDPQIDALIEKTETEIRPDEQIKLVKQAQLEMLKKYTGNYMIVTPEQYQFRNAKLQDFEVIASTQAMYRPEMWFNA